MAGVKFVGTVKSFNDGRGFGFIEPKDGGKDVFVHQTSIKMEGHRTLNEGEFVEYYVEDVKKTTKVKASAVAVIDEEEFKAYSTEEYDAVEDTVECYNCGGFGHLARDCSSLPNYECCNCHKLGHMSRQCPERKIERCYTCNGIGHMARGCKKGNKNHYGNGNVGVGGGEVKCYNCGEAGHVKKDCDKERAVVVKKNGGGGGGDGKCYNCGEAGHLRRDCKKERVVERSNGGERRRDEGCFNCGKPGHFARECTQY